jgi:hypothetical protein
VRRQNPQKERDHDDPRHGDGVGKVHEASPHDPCLWRLGSIIALSQIPRFSTKDGPVGKRVHKVKCGCCGQHAAMLG